MNFCEIMSVFDDFQRMWMQKFPHSNLSDKWEQDVRASLSRHRQKIVDLTKELEQETQYCEYLERLLLDVEKFRENGGGGADEAPESGNNMNAHTPEHLSKVSFTFITQQQNFYNSLFITQFFLEIPPCKEIVL